MYYLYEIPAVNHSPSVAVEIMTFPILFCFVSLRSWRHYVGL